VTSWKIMIYRRNAKRKICTTRPRRYNIIGIIGIIIIIIIIIRGTRIRRGYINIYIYGHARIGDGRSFRNGPAVK